MKLFTLNENVEETKILAINNYQQLEEIENQNLKNIEKEIFKKQISRVNFSDKNKSDNSLNDKNLNVNIFSEPTLEDNLFDIIYKLKHNTNMNLLIKTINKILLNEKKQPFNKENMVITLNSKELDKFLQKDKVKKNFSVEICYSLRED